MIPTQLFLQSEIKICSEIKLVYAPGALAIAVANPTDLVKVRLQSEGKLAPGVPRRYTGAMNAYSTIVRQVSFFCSWAANYMWNVIY
jgi:solute carrier family 25 uncoupling protein 8/9